ncbi:hypothetical protein HZC09_01080 [Candidatus Micrarchaeota archaeon]|nr:hypothetical protein [Candidatus Micrarchaeota archaeon]
MHFAEVASGKVGENVMMFLDRPANSALLVEKKTVPSSPSVQETLAKEGDDIKLYYIEDFNASDILKIKPETIIVPDYLKTKHQKVYDALKKAGYSYNISSPLKLVDKTEEELAPEMFGQLGFSTVFSWKAIGLRSAPVLQVEPIKRASITQYSITGSSQGDTEQEKVENAILEVKQLKSVLTGGRLPVAASVGSYYNIAPSLGEQFLMYSLYGIAIAIILVAVVIMLYYRRLELIVPIVFTNVIEIFVLLALLGGLGTLDLAAMAGVIALIGTGVDNQIVITDELLKKRGEDVSPKRKLKDAFFIVFSTAGVAFASMLPLLMSGIVEIMGFAIATVLGVILGVLITRPAYGAIVEEMVFKTNE